MYAGVVISKDRLDVSLPGQGPSHYANSASGTGQLIKVLAGLAEPVRVICEPSGGYERALLAALWAAKIAVSLVNAARIRAFARTQGLLAKTDQIDATVLREFGELPFWATRGWLRCHALRSPPSQLSSQSGGGVTFKGRTLRSRVGSISSSSGAGMRV